MFSNLNWAYILGYSYLISVPANREFVWKNDEFVSVLNNSNKFANKHPGTNYRLAYLLSVHKLHLCFNVN
jgi:hypothetical protein